MKSVIMRCSSYTNMDMEQVDQKMTIDIGRKIVNALLNANAHRSDEIIAGIEGERFHTHDTHAIVLLLTNDKASPALQIAAMGHDVERFTVPGSGEGYKGSRSGPEYERYKKNHAKIGADLMNRELLKENIPQSIRKRIVFLITHHDDTAQEIQHLSDTELEVLVAADSLSWLNFSAPNYFNGREKKGIQGLRDKMIFMLRKLPKQFWSYLPMISLREPKILPYLIESATLVAQELEINPPQFNEKNLRGKSLVKKSQ